MSMGFNQVVRDLIDALLAGRFQHDPRFDPAGNMLQLGLVTPEDVVEMLRAAHFKNHEVSPHRKFPEIDVHIFTSRLPSGHWYVKAYFLEDGDDEAFFISVHQ